MTRTLALFVAGSLAGIALLSGVYFARDGWIGVFCAVSAGLICLIPTALSLVVTLWSRGRSASEQLMAVMGGMVFRMGAVLAMSLPLFLSVPQLRESRERELLFWSAVLICYMGTLAGETFLTARSRKTTLNAGHTPAAANGGGAL